MRALVLEAFGRFAVREIDDPVPGPNDALISVSHSGICGSELAGFQGRDGLREVGLVFGHEFVGQLMGCGSAVDPTMMPPAGTTVTANPLRVCGGCPMCVGGRENVCRRRQLLGAHRAGSNAELLVVPSAAVVAVEADDPTCGALAEPAACALRAVRRASVGPGTSALVVGAGPIGLLLVACLRLAGADPVWFTETVPARAAAAEAAGGTWLSAGPEELLTAVRAATSGLGADVTFDAVGTEQTRVSVLECVRPGGQAVLVGLHAPETTLPIRHLIRGEIDLLTSYASTHRDFADAVRLLATGRLTFTGKIVTAGLDDGQLWFERLLAGSPVGKVLLAPRLAAAAPAAAAAFPTVRRPAPVEAGRG